MKLNRKLAHPELEIILEKLNKLKFSHYGKEKQMEEIQSEVESPENVKHIELEEFMAQIRLPIKTNSIQEKNDFRAQEATFRYACLEHEYAWYPDLITWGDLFLIIKQ